ncbi:MAG: nuclear transport factor 2 family protein [Nitrospirae bacterium]|nr:nuclear transport factor 2 family protein [Nitrospirota bacterium]
MKRVMYALIVAAAVLMMSKIAICGSGKPIGQDVFKTQVKKVLDDMNDAFLKGDIDGFFKYVAHDADIVAVDIMNDDYVVGYDRVVEHMKKSAAMKATYKCTLLDETVRVSSSARVAWTAQLSDCTLTIEERTVSAKVRATATFERRGGSWLLVQEHDSIGLPHVKK